MKFIHLADAHLDSPFRGLSFLQSSEFNKIYQAADKSLTRIVDLALTEEVDLVLIAGDTFDSNHPSPRSQLFFAGQIKRLTDAKIQVVMIFGNHDHMKKDELLVSPSPYFKLLGADEKVEKASFSTKTGFKYDVVGFSYLNNHIQIDKMPNFPKKVDQYTFGLMHAQEKTNHPSHDNYAPFTLSEIKDLNYDYFALGHIHLRQNLSKKPWIVYPGNIQGRHVNELGEKGCYLGEVNEQTKETKIDFYKTAPITWKSRKLILTSSITKSQLRLKILDILKTLNNTFYSLQILGAQYLNSEEVDLMQDTDFTQNISTDLAAGSNLVDVRLLQSEAIHLNSSDQAAFDQALTELFTCENFVQITKQWNKKDEVTARLAADPEFLDTIKNLAQLKITHKLKGIDDETQTN